MLHRLNKRYVFDQSPFYCLRSKKKLASILGVSPQDLKYLSQKDELYIERDRFDEKKGKLRHEEEPKYPLKLIHKRIQVLLVCIELPNFVYCPGVGHSHVENARIHADSAVLRKIDIKSYFQCTTSRRVYWFFHKRMKCSSDVAGVLTAISTFNGHLPTGSPLSPILSYYAHTDMWDSIYRIARNANCTLSIWMDDITISGAIVSESLMWEIKRIIHRNDLQYHKEKLYAGERAREVTGSVITGGELKAPNRLHKKLHQLHQQLCKETNFDKRVKLGQRIEGLKAQIQQIQCT